MRCFDDICRKNGSLEVNCIGDIDFTVINEVMSALEVLYHLFQEGNVETAFCEVIFVSSFLAPIASVEIRAYFLASDDADILW